MKSFILCVEDDLDVLELYRLAFESSNDYIFIPCDDPGMAFSIFEDYHPRISVVILDYKMSPFNGYQLLKKMKKLDAHQKYVLASGTPIAREESNEFDLCFSKPFSIVDFVEKVKTLAQGVFSPTNPI